MEITPDQITKSARFGVELLSSNTLIPTARIDDAQVLRAILAGIASGEIVLGKPPKPDTNKGPRKRKPVRR